MHTIHEKLDLANQVQALEHRITDQQRQIHRCESRIRSQRHKKWRNAAVRLIAEIADVDTTIVPSTLSASFNAETSSTSTSFAQSASLSLMGTQFAETRQDLESTLAPQDEG